MCIVFSIVGCVYWYLRVTLSSMFVGESSYVSFPRYVFLCIHFVTSFVREWDEWSSPRGFGLLSLPLLHSLLIWLHSTFDLSWSSLFFIYSLFLYHPHYCFQFIIFVSPSCPCLIVTYSRFATLFASFFFTYLIINSICFIFLLIDNIFTLGTLGPWLTSFLYMLHFIHKGMIWSLGIWA